MHAPAGSDAPQPSTPTGAAPQSAGTQYVADSEVHLLDRLAVLYRYRRLCVTVFVLATAAMIIQGYTNVQVFQAQGRLQIDEERSTAVPGLQNDLSYYEDPEPYFNTQHKILKGRDLTRRVVRAMHLETIPEFNGTAAAPPTPISMIHDLEARLVGFVRPAATAVEPPKADESADESGLVAAFLGRVNIEPVRGSHLVDVTFTAQDPHVAQKAVNALMDEYVESNLQLKLGATDNMLKWLSDELVKQQEKLEASERALAEYRAKENALSLDEKQNIVITRLNQLNDSATKANVERSSRENVYNQVKAIGAGTA